MNRFAPHILANFRPTPAHHPPIPHHRPIFTAAPW
jgi:hypothetical protein